MSEISKVAEMDKSAMHEAAESRMKPFHYIRPTEGYVRGKAMVSLTKTDILKATVQVLKEGGENNLHYHTKIDSFWYVLRGRVRFYGVGDQLLGEFGPHEGIVTPRGARYWFESVGPEELELLQVAANVQPGAPGTGRLNVNPNRHPPRVVED